MPSDYQDREQRFQRLLANWPKSGDILESLNGEPAEVIVDERGNSLLMYTMAIIDDACTGWYLSYDQRGVMAMIDMRDHEELLQRAAEVGPKVTVGRLRVLRKSARNTCVICELMEKRDAE